MAKVKVRMPASLGTLILQHLSGSSICRYDGRNTALVTVELGWHRGTAEQRLHAVLREKQRPNRLSSVAILDSQSVETLEGGTAQDADTLHVWGQ